MDGFALNTLAFDTALNGCTVACVAAGGAPVTRQIETGRDQAAKLVPLIQDCMDEAGVTFKALDKLITTVGPGSFTGLRIGLSTARSFALALEKKLVGVTTLAVAAQQALRAASGAPFCVLLETKRSDFYAQLFDARGVAASEPLAASAHDILTQLNGHFLFGDAAARFVAETHYTGGYEGMTLLDPLDLLTVGYAAESAAEPLYLRGADVSQPKKSNTEIIGDISGLFT